MGRKIREIQVTKLLLLLGATVVAGLWRPDWNRLFTYDKQNGGLRPILTGKYASYIKMS